MSKSTEDHKALEIVALQIYGAVAAGSRHTPDHNAVLRAFQHAKVFQSVSSKILAGEIPCEMPEPDEPDFIKCPLVVLVSDTPGEQTKWKPVTDPLGNPLFETLLVDRDSFAPNLPADHPINLRYKPRPGAKTVVEHQADEKARRAEEHERRLKADQKLGMLEKLNSMFS